MSDLLDPKQDEAAHLAKRNEAVRQMNEAMAAARSFERERRTRRAVTIGGGWIVAAMFAGIAIASLGVMWNRPVPRDRFLVSILHDDGSYDAPIIREDLPVSRREMLFRHSVIQYVLARENYTYQGVNANYRLVSAMSTPKERDRYQAVMTDARNPANPAVMYGDGPNSATVDVTGIQVHADPASAYAVDAVLLVKIIAPNKPERTIRKTARMTWVSAEAEIPADIQQRYDPAGIAFDAYLSTPDPDTAR